MTTDYPLFPPRLSKTRVILCLVYAAVMGRWYNRQIQDIQDAGHEWDNRAPLVAVGVFFTLLGLLPLFPVRVFLAALGLFVASGTPMILGSAGRKNQTIDFVDDWHSDFNDTLNRLEKRWLK